MIRNFTAKFIYFRLLKWKLEGEFPKLDKYIIVAIPHTSYKDLFMALLVRSISCVKTNFVAKKELFGVFTGWFFKIIGCIPVNRGAKENTVDAVVEIFNKRPKFKLVISPEGTRKKAAAWKTGFYYISTLAKVQIVPVVLDCGRKKITIHPPFNPTGDIKSDFKFLRSKLQGAIGFISQNT